MKSAASISLGLAAAAALSASSGGAWAWSVNLTAGNDVYIIGCVTRPGFTSRIWACNANTGTWTQVNVDCTMDEDIFIFGGLGNDVIYVGHGLDHGYGSTYTCGGETREFADIVHSWAGSNWDIFVLGEGGSDTIFGDQSLYTYVLGGDGADDLRQYGSASLEGDAGGDRLISPNWSWDLEQMFGGTGWDCLEDGPDDQPGETEASAFDCGTGSPNSYVDCCDFTSPAQPTGSCGSLVTSCLPGGPGFAAGGEEF